METIKKEKKDGLEQLLNSLIEKGWKPRGNKCEYVRYTVLSNQPYKFQHLNAYFNFSLREICSKESGLWQFVCENMLINKKWFYGDEYCIAEHCEYTPKYYKFRLIESSLKDESELEQFLLNSIKLD